MAASLVVLAHAAPAGALRFWVGVEAAETAMPCVPVFDLRVDGQRVSAQKLALRRVYPDGGDDLALQELRLAGLARSPAPHFRFGAYECASPRPGCRLAVAVEVCGVTDRTECTDLAALQCAKRPLALGVSSCYWGPNAHAAALVARLHALGARLRVPCGQPPCDLMLLLGDQVYLDLPALRDVPNDEWQLAAQFTNAYVENFVRRAGTSAVTHAGAPRRNPLLKAGMLLAIGDDHELWNNAPNPVFYVDETMTQGDRARWIRVAAQLFKAFQDPFAWAPDASGLVTVPRVDGATRIHAWRRVELGAFSLFLCDAIWQRRNGRLLDPGTLDAAARWIDELVSSGRAGVFCFGGSLFSEAAGFFESRIVDHAPADFPDHAALMGILARARGPLLLVGGDLHFGRIGLARGRIPAAEGNHDMIEILCSPSALIDTPVKDRINEFRRGADRWPRHDDPEWNYGRPPPGRGFGGADSSAPRIGMRGDQFGLLRLGQRWGKPAASFAFHGVLDEVVEEGVELYPAYGANPRFDGE